MLQTKLKNLIKKSKDVFNSEYLNKIARSTHFVKRKSKITPEIFLSYHTFSGSDLCDKSLSTLCGRISSHYGVLVSPQALHERYNYQSAEFMRIVFNDMMINQNRILNDKMQKQRFNRILINDSTSYALPDSFAEEFKGAGGTHSKSAIKIQLQYDLLSGSFSNCEFQHGVTNDSKYLDVMSNHIERGDLKLADLGYYKIDYLKAIADKEAFFISKIKSHTVLYQKNPNPRYTKRGKILKPTEYTKINVLELIESLADDQTLELKDIVIGSKKELKTRLIITKLSEKNKEKRRIKHLSEVKRSRGTINPRSVAWNSVNVYVTNVPEEMLSTNEIHDVYSLRWQIEIMFKVWKSVFEINKVKKMKIERFKCFLYGRLIALLFSTIVVFSAKDIIKKQDNKDISELKSYQIIIEFFHDIRKEIFENDIYLCRLLKRIIESIKKYALKSKKKGKKTSNEIVNNLCKRLSLITNIAN